MGLKYVSIAYEVMINNYFIVINFIIIQKKFKLLKKLILENPQFNVLVSKSSEQTIAEFFESVDVHLSHESSCSLQAFAFGMPTLITTYQGAKNFKFWIDQSLMFYNSDCSDLCESIQMLLEIEPGRAFEAAREVFGSDSDFRQAISYLIASLE